MRAACGREWGVHQPGDHESGAAATRADPQKKTFRATEQDTSEGRAIRAAYHEAVHAVTADALIFVDETGTHIDLARLYAWAPCGQRAYATKPRNRGRALTLIGALGWEGVVATLSIEGGTDGVVFRTYIEQVLAPRLRPGQVVVMDNLKAHKVAGIREAIEAAGARLLYLPPYSPELSPIELAWSKLKAFLRARAARTREALEQALADALTTLTSHDAQQWFRHCGYCPTPN
jgi:transposase